MSKGYKQTDVGVIPEDWDVSTLNDLVDTNRPIRYGIVQPGKYEPEGRYMVRGQDYSFGWANPYDLFRVSSEVEERYKNARIKGGDIILTIVGAGTGHLEVVPDWLEGANITQTTARIAIEKDKADSKYCKYYFQTAAGKKQISVYIKGAAQPGLNIGDVKIFQIPLPPTKTEQTAIATALSDADALISNLEKLIEKKRNIKQGAMQQLLKPKEGWVVKKLGEIGTVIRGASPRPQGDSRFYGGNIPRLMVEDVTRDGKYVTPKVDFLTEEGAKRSRPCKAGTLTIVCSGTVGIPSILSVDACIHDGFLALIKIKQNYVIDFLYHQLTTLREKFEASATHGGVFTNLTTAVIKEFEVSFPSYEEQQNIAEVLSDMDTEITSLEEKLSKFKMLKQGMMQELLTGKTRLV